MSCAHHRPLIDRFVDGELERGALAELDLHLASCPACRRLAEDLQRIRRAAAGLERLAPPPGAWRRIAGALEREVERAQPAGAVSARRSPLSRPWLAAAASLALAVGAAVLLLVGRIGVEPPASRGALSPGAAAPEQLVQTVGTELRLAAEHYEKAIAGLEQIANLGDSPLDSDLVATLRTNLGVIDRAIAESRAAIEAQPESQLAQESLFSAFRRKVALLQDTIALINEVRKGDVSGAARAADTLNKS